jgi:hypothetical protein
VVTCDVVGPPGQEPGGPTDGFWQGRRQLICDRWRQLAEDADAARSDKERDDDQDDAEQDLTANKGHNSPNTDQNRKYPK